MGSAATEPEASDAPGTTRDFFEVYKLAIEDLHHTKDLAQKIDSLYLTIVTLLLTADAYEVATSRFDAWVPSVATAAVALIGIAVTGRWRRGADNLFQITTNRYAWLRAAEDASVHPEMRRLGANIFTQECQIPHGASRGRVRSTPGSDQPRS
jgi:hypothetical protein